MPPVPETSARPPDPVANDYDSFAEAYSAENEASLLGASYNRPALLDLYPAYGDYQDRTEREIPVVVLTAR